MLAVAAVPISEFVGTTQGGSLCELIVFVRGFFTDHILNAGVAIFLLAGAMWAFSVISSGALGTAKELLSRIVVGIVVVYGGGMFMAALSKVIGVDILSFGCISSAEVVPVFDFSPERFAPEQAMHFWDNMKELLKSVIIFAIQIITAVASLGVVVGGFMYFAGGTLFGNTGKGMIVYSFVGLIIALFGYEIVSFTLGAIGVPVPDIAKT